MILVFLVNHKDQNVHTVVKNLLAEIVVDLQFANMENKKHIALIAEEALYVYTKNEKRFAENVTEVHFVHTEYINEDVLNAMLQICANIKN